MKRKLLDELYRLKAMCEAGINRYSGDRYAENDAEYDTAQAIYKDRKNDIERLIDLILEE